MSIEPVVLEPQLARHAAELYPLLSHSALHEFTDSEPPESEAWLEERFRHLETRQSPDLTEKWLNWVIRRPSGEAVGYVQATVYDDRSAEVAFVLGVQFWGMGLAFAATNQMLATLAREYGVKRFLATVDAMNTRSIKLLGRLGFTEISRCDEHNLEFEFTMRKSGANGDAS